MAPPLPPRIPGAADPLPVPTLLLTGLIVETTGGVLPGAHITTFWSAARVPIVLTASSVVLGGFLAINYERQYERFVTRHVRRAYPHVPKTDVPEIVFIEIDGLAEPVLRQAIDAGRVPTIERWLANGHRLVRWEPDFPPRPLPARPASSSATSTSPPAKPFTAASRAAGHGRAATLPTRLTTWTPEGYRLRRLPVRPVLRLDYVWVSHHWRPLDAYLGPDAGSDHLSPIATLQLRK